MSARLLNSHPVRRHGAGFTIIELMVGMLVGLIACVVMFQVFAISEGQKRTTTGAGDAQQNGVGSVFVIERDARMAGFGMSYQATAGCWVNGYNQIANQAFQFRMAPYDIANGAGGSPDSLTVAFGDTRNFTSPGKLNTKMASASADFQPVNTYGYALGDVVVLAEDARPCSMYQIQKRDGAKYGHEPGSYNDVNGVSRTTVYNKAGGPDIVKPATDVPLAYNEWNRTTERGGRLLNLGQNPTVVRYALEGNQLVARNVLNPDIVSAPPIVISDGVVQFQVQYAFDFNGDGSVAADAPVKATLDTTEDQWADALPANPTTAMWRGIIGVRFAIVARSATPERPNAATGICETTTANPKWLAIAPARDLDISADADWRCYRYRVFEITVPARNLMWMPDEGA